MTAPARSATSLIGLTRRSEFLAASRSRRASAASLSLQARERNPSDPLDAGADPDAVRVGFTCSKKVGNAVARNRAKRRLREAARAVLSGDGRPGWDYVLIGRAHATAERPYDALINDLREALRRVHEAPKPRAPKRPAAPQSASAS